MRELNDKKGGGLSIIHNANTYVEITKEKERHKDVLHATCIANKVKFNIILTYLATNDEGRKQAITRHIDSILQQHEEEPTIFLGDFNGHLGFIRE